MAQIITSILPTDFLSPMARSWSHHRWNNLEDNSYSSWQSHSQAPQSFSPSFAPDIPTHWRETDVHYDETCLHGYPLFKTIQPTAWSRKRGLHGMDPMQAPLAALCRYQSQEFALRPFSASRFLGVVPTRTVAESVLCNQFLKAVREQAVDIDGIPEHLHRTQAPSRLIPSKVDTPIEFMQPAVTELINRLKGIQPQQADTSAVRRLQSVQAELAHAKQQLAEAGISPESARAQAADNTPEFKTPTAKPLGRDPGTKHPPTSKASQLGASPKKCSRGSVVASQAVAPKSNATLDTFWNSALPAGTSASHKGDAAGEDSPPGQKDPRTPTTLMRRSNLKSSRRQKSLIPQQRFYRIIR